MFKDAIFLAALRIRQIVAKPPVKPEKIADAILKICENSVELADFLNRYVL
jgi:predicted P-loop ATPase/GTPase